MTERVYGWKRQKKDIRDYKYSPKLKVEELPRRVDLRSKSAPVFDQGSLGSCTANALAGLLGDLEIRNNDTYTPISRLMIYYDEREIEGTISEDSGANPRDGIKTLSEKGACRESLWEYNISKFTVKPPQSAYDEALDYKITKYESLSTLDEMKSCLASGNSFAFGFIVYESFESPEVVKTGLVPMPKPNELAKGGHYVKCVGYDLDRQLFTGSIGTAIIRNSYGTSWGINGDFLMPLEYLADSKLSYDFWVINADVTDPILEPTPKPVPEPKPIRESLLDKIINFLSKIIHYIFR